MTAEPALFSMLRFELETPKLLARSPRAHAGYKLDVSEVDVGYLVHSELAALFGELGPKPFRVLEPTSGRTLSVLAYSERSKDELVEHARAFADPAAWDACDWDRLCAKQLPADWRTGQRLGFELRACPVLRMAKAGEQHQRGAEVDAFLAACWAAGPKVEVEREAVYRDWLRRQLEPSGAVKLEAVRLRGFRRSWLLRQTQGSERTPKRFERPDALFEGVLEIADPAAFGRLLARGVGRHRAFGFGMLLLRPARAATC